MIGSDGRPRVTEAHSLDGDGARLFEGADHGGVALSFFLTDTPPGGGPRLHVHPYPEVFVVQQGTAAFRVGEATIEASEGQIVVAPPGQAHTFTNAGHRPLRMVTLHPSDRVVTDWLTE
ncbi:MAG: cupin domain-containing protein [Candidatus Dormibacter sp.]|uniref:cupin domain-containing protein n=1 Tax=Candidatus Dormibacter sp. TaxID=2973982 RepID=UPI000DB372BE|nr:MAG: cupin domain-containing protein [Candidatus Dormibacteraeota bacterium]